MIYTAPQVASTPGAAVLPVTVGGALWLGGLFLLKPGRAQQGRGVTQINLLPLGCQAFLSVKMIMVLLTQ